MNTTAAAKIAVQMHRAQRMPAIFGGDQLGEFIHTLASAEGWDFDQTRAHVAAARSMQAA
jgi:hypothetical protein